MKAYQKAEMIAKNLPTGSYAAGCPVGRRAQGCGPNTAYDANGAYHGFDGCAVCEIAA